MPPVVVGSASRDLTPDDRRGWRLGGAVAYAGLTLARLGLAPRVLIGCDGSARQTEELQWLREAGADVRIVPLEEGPVFANEMTPNGRVQICTTPGMPIPTDAVPDDWRDATSWCLLPVAGEIEDAWAAVPPGDAMVALGWQGLLRTLTRGGTVVAKRPGQSALLDRSTLVGLSREDVGPRQTEASLIELLCPPVTLVVTNGADGGRCVDVDALGRVRTRRYPAIRSDEVVDPTGAGDAFLAGMVAARLGHPLGGSGQRGTDLRLAAAIGSLVVERPGLLGVPTLVAVAERLRRSLRMPVAEEPPLAPDAPLPPEAPPPSG